MIDSQTRFAFAPRPKLKLAEIERLIRKHRIVVPCPSRQTLIAMCEDGRLESAHRRDEKSPWLVFEESFLRWVRDMELEPDEASSLDLAA